MGAIRRCIETVHDLGAPRVSTFVKISSRTDRTQTSEEMVRSVEAKLGGARRDRR
jgi:uncharacterized protein YqgV (UPF0045/DUF77 family)